MVYVADILEAERPEWCCPECWPSGGSHLAVSNHGRCHLTEVYEESRGHMVTKHIQGPSFLFLYRFSQGYLN